MLLEEDELLSELLDSELSLQLDDELLSVEEDSELSDELLSLEIELLDEGALLDELLESELSDELLSLEEDSELELTLLSELLDSELTLLLDDALLGAEELLSLEDDSELELSLSLDELLESELTLLLDEELLSLEIELLDDSELNDEDELLDEGALLDELLDSELSEELLSLETELLDDSELDEEEDSLDVLLEEGELLSELLDEELLSLEDDSELELSLSLDELLDSEFSDELLDGLGDSLLSLLDSELDDTLLSLEDDSELELSLSLDVLLDEDALLSELLESSLESELTLRSAGVMAAMNVSGAAGAAGPSGFFPVRFLQANKFFISFFIGRSFRTAPFQTVTFVPSNQPRRSRSAATKSPRMEIHRPARVFLWLPCHCSAQEESSPPVRPNAFSAFCYPVRHISRTSVKQKGAKKAQRADCEEVAEMSSVLGGFITARQ